MDKSVFWATYHHSISNFYVNSKQPSHYDDVIMTMLASQSTSLMVVYSIVYSGVNQGKHQSPAPLAFVREIHRGPVNFPHKWPVTRKMFPFDDVIMCTLSWSTHTQLIRVRSKLYNTFGIYVIYAVSLVINIDPLVLSWGGNIAGDIDWYHGWCSRAPCVGGPSAASVLIM